jgi:hypothetical protein
MIIYKALYFSITLSLYMSKSKTIFIPFKSGKAYLPATLIGQNFSYLHIFIYLGIQNFIEVLFLCELIESHILLFIQDIFRVFYFYVYVWLHVYISHSCFNTHVSMLCPCHTFCEQRE